MACEFLRKEQPPKLVCFFERIGWVRYRTGTELSCLLSGQTWCAIFMEGMMRVI